MRQKLKFKKIDITRNCCVPNITLRRYCFSKTVKHRMYLKLHANPNDNYFAYNFHKLDNAHVRPLNDVGEKSSRRRGEEHQ